MGRIIASITVVLMLIGVATIFAACHAHIDSPSYDFGATVEARVTEELARTATSPPDVSLIIKREIEKELYKLNLERGHRGVEPLAPLIFPTTTLPENNPIQEPDQGNTDNQTPTPLPTVPSEEPVLPTSIPDPTSVPTSSHYLERGKAYYRQKEYSEALIEFTKVIDLSPKFLDGYQLRGNSYYHLEEYQFAIDDYQKATQIDSNDTDLLTDYGKALTAIGKYDEAISYYNKATSIKPQEPHAFHYRAIAHSKLSKFRQSNADYARACALSDQYCPILVSLNICSEEDIERPHIIYGQGTAVRVSAWIDDDKLLEVMTGGATKNNAPYSLPLSVCDNDFWSLIGKTVKFKLDKKWALQTTLLQAQTREKINLSLGGDRFDTTTGLLPLDPEYRDAKNGLRVMLTKLKKTTIGNVTTIEIAYTLRNPTPNLILEGSWKLFYKNGGGLPKYGFFNNILPGATLSRSYTFQVQSPNIPATVGYPSDFFAESPAANDQTWSID